jgi:concanavalin A-like lectin/glucanase superfamily protein
VGSFFKYRTKEPYKHSLNRAHSLCNKLIFACAPGWAKGFTANGFQTEYDDYNMSRGIFNTTVPNASPFIIGPGGRGLDNGDGSFNSVPEYLPSGAADTRYDITYGFTASVLVRPDLLSTDGTLPFFKHMNQPYNATTPGWCFTGAAGNVWRFQMSNGDGVNQRNVNSVTTQDANLERADLLTATLLPTAGGGITVRMYVNGQFEAQQTSAAINGMGNPANTPIKFLGLGTAAAGQPAYSGFVSFGAVWERVLADSEILALARDPFVLWRPNRDMEMALGGLLAQQTYFIAF